MNTYLYKITNIERDPSGTAIACSFDLTASDGVDSFIYHGYTGFTPPPANPIPFAQLTEQTVIGWVKALVGEEVEGIADAELSAMKSRKNYILGLPW